MTDGEPYPAFGGTPRKFLIFVILLSIGLGLTYLHNIREIPQFREAIIDEWSYDSKAMGLLNGSWPGRKVFYQDPLYPYFLAPVYKVFGHNVVTVKVIQVLLGGLHVLLIYGIARRTFGRGTGMTAALIAALYKPMFFFEGILTKEVLSLVLVDLSLLTLLWARVSPKNREEWVTESLFVHNRRTGTIDMIRNVLVWAIPGVFLGMACLTRANLLLMAPVWGIWCFLSMWRERGFRWGIISTAVFVLGAALAISPATIHNWRSGDFVLITSQSGQNFYIGNHPGNRSGTYASPPFLRAHPKFEERDFRREAKRLGQTGLSPSELSRFWYGQTIDYAIGDPRQFWGNMALKSALFFNNFELPDNINYQFYRKRFSWVLRLPLPTYGVISAFGLFGWLVLLVRRRRVAWTSDSLSVQELERANDDARTSRSGLSMPHGSYRNNWWPLALFLPIYAFSVIAFYVFARYRIPALAALIPLSAFGLKEFYRLLTQSGRRKLLGSVVFVGGLCVFAFWPLKEPAFDVAYYQLGNGYFRQGRFEDAERELRQAVILNPEVLPFRLNLGQAIYEQGRYEDAAEEFERAVALYPRHPGTRENLGNAYSMMGRYEDAVTQYELAFRNGERSPRLFTNLGLALKELGRMEEARSSFEKALEINKKYTPAIEQLHNLKSNTLP